MDDPDFIDEPIEVGTGHHPELKTMRKVIDMLDATNGQKKRSLESVQALYPWFHRSYTERFRARLMRTRADKLKGLNRWVMDRFRVARQKNQPLHGRTIQRWARQWTKQIDLTDFGASSSWLDKFKRRNDIVSRKVTNYVELDKAPLVAQSIIDFGPRYKNASSQVPNWLIWNFDQSGFNYEPTNLRTLSFKGERDTQLLVDIKNKATHSYTVLNQWITGYIR